MTRLMRYDDNNINGCNNDDSDHDLHDDDINVLFTDSSSIFMVYRLPA